jgi:hypothetical protein
MACFPAAYTIRAMACHLKATESGFLPGLLVQVLGAFPYLVVPMRFQA